MAKSAEEIRDDILRTIRNGLISRGIANPDVGPGSDYYVTASAVATELAVEGANREASTDAVMADTATGSDLDRQLKIKGLARRGPGPSKGGGGFVTASPTLVITGQEVLDPTGGRYTVDTGGTYADGDTIRITSVAVGKKTNLPGGTTMRWVTPPAYASSSFQLDANGTLGGVDAEDDETARARLLDRMANPPGGGNWSQIAELGEAAVEVQKAFPYPACNGPSTTHVAVVGYASGNDARSRVVSPAGLTEATNAILGEVSEYAEFVITSVTDTPIAVSIKLSMPSTAWVDSSPWPIPRDSGGVSTLTACDVSAVFDSTNVAVNAGTVPVVGQSIAWIRPSDFSITTAKITAVSSTGSGPYSVSITVDTPLVGIVVGDYLMPAAGNLSLYRDAVLASFAALGPGEKVTAPGVLPRGYRRPRTFDSWPSAVGPQFLRAVVESSEEVLDASFYTPTTSPVPAVPSLVSNAPRIWVPKQIGFYMEVNS